MNASIENPHFLLRRLHSLFGLLPVGAFLIFHLWENSQSRLGMEHYNVEVFGALQSMNYLPLLEIFAIALPLLFHAGYGLVILRGGRSELGRYRYLHNRLYWLQRISGVGVLLFLLLHVGWTRILGMFDPSVHENLFGHMQGLLSHPLGFTIYLIGMLLAVFHLCNGLWTMAIAWGLTTSVHAQQLSFWFCSGLASILTALGLHGLMGFLS
jgi:succinate dehydrogenase / fumarate reductase cytochrome b subunit